MLARQALADLCSCTVHHNVPLTVNTMPTTAGPGGPNVRLLEIVCKTILPHTWATQLLLRLASWASVLWRCIIGFW